MEDSQDLLLSPHIPSGIFQHRGSKRLPYSNRVFPPLLTHYHKAKYKSPSHETQYHENVFNVNLSGIPTSKSQSFFQLAKSQKLGLSMNNPRSCAWKLMDNLCLSLLLPWSFSTARMLFQRKTELPSGDHVDNKRDV